MSFKTLKILLNSKKNANKNYDRKECLARRQKVCTFSAFSMFNGSSPKTKRKKKRKLSDIVEYFSENREVKVAKNIQVLIHVNVNTTP